MYKYKNYEILSKYFNALALDEQKMPNMTAIANITGVSTSTISRYAIRRGYYSFPAMRASFNQSLDNEKFNDYGLLKNLAKYKNKKIVVLASISTKIIGMHLVNRLKNLGFEARNVQNIWKRKEAISSIDPEEIILFISITGESNWYAEMNHLKNEMIIISTYKLRDQDNRHFILISKFAPKSKSYFDKNQSVIKLLKWCDDAMNIISIEATQKKGL